MLPSSDKRPDNRQAKFQMVSTLGSTSTWQDLPEHWLRFQSAENFETREQVKRQARRAALARGRRLPTAAGLRREPPLLCPSPNPGK